MLEELKRMADVRVTRAGDGLSRPSIAARLTAAGVPHHEPLLAWFSEANGIDLVRADIELAILDLDWMLEGNAWQHLQEFSGLDDAEAREALEPYHVFAKHERSLWLCNLQTLETAVAFDFDVEPLPLSLSQMVVALIANHFSPGWYRTYLR